MTDLATFLRARLDEDEAVARAATPRHADDWTHDHGMGCETSENAWRHVARHDPARILADVASKREIVLLASDRADGDEDSPWSEGSYSIASHMGFVMRHLAAVYTTHPDYDEAWRP